jgi:hypothetical protein
VKLALRNRIAGIINQALTDELSDDEMEELYLAGPRTLKLVVDDDGLGPVVRFLKPRVRAHRPGEVGFAGMITYRCPIHGDVIACKCKPL